MTKRIDQVVDTEDELLKTIKKSIPNLKDIKYDINLSFYDVDTSTTYIISDPIDTYKDAYTDNTYTIVYDKYNSNSIRNYPDSYYVTTIDDLVTVISFIVNHQDVYAVYSTSYSDDDRDDHIE